MGLGAAGTAAAIGAAGAIGSSALSSAGGASGGSSKQQINTGPWAPQQPFAQAGLSDAQNVYNARMAQGVYSGQLQAGVNPILQDAADSAAVFHNGTGAGLPEQTAATAGGLQSYAPQYAANAANLAQNGITGPNGGLYGTLWNFASGAAGAQGPNSGLSSALNSAAMNSANSLNGYNQGLQSAAERGLSDPTQRIANDAATYANNPGVQSAIHSTNANIENVLNEQTVPGLNRQASMSGNLNSSRAGMAEAMANHDAALAEGNADSQILNNAYNTGMGTASSLYSNGLNTAAGANSSGLSNNGTFALNTGNQQQQLGMFNAGQQLNSANMGLTQGLGYELGNANTQLAANGQLGSGVNAGIAGASAAGQQAQNNFNLGAGAGQLGQQWQQAADNNAYQQWQLQNQYPQSVLNNYWQIASTPLGTNGTTTVSNQLPPNYAGNLLGGAAAGAGLYQSFGGGYGANNNGLYNFGPSGSMPNGMGSGGMSVGADGQLYNSGGIF